MTGYLRRKLRTIGAAPGTGLPTSDPTRPIQIRLMRWAPGGELEARTVRSADELPDAVEGTTLWVDIVGNGDVEAIRAIATRYGVPGVVLEDALDVTQRPLATLDPDFHFVSMRRVWAEDSAELGREQLAAWLSEGLVLTFQEVDGDGWDPIRARIGDPSSILRSRGEDYLWYRLIDANVDGLFPVLDRLADQVESVEEDVFSSRPDDIPARLGQIRKEAVILRRAAWPLAEALDRVVGSEEAMVGAETRRLFEDVRDHARQITEVNEVFREAVAANMDTYISLVSMEQNEVMRVLTLVATIFIPLTFVAGIYGMNFENMPELGHPMGYPLVWVVMISIAIGLLAFFRRKGWL